jgi:hypothetical protein
MEITFIKSYLCYVLFEVASAASIVAWAVITPEAVYLQPVAILNILLLMIDVMMMMGSAEIDSKITVHNVMVMLILYINIGWCITEIVYQSLARSIFSLVICLVLSIYLCFKKEEQLN